MIEKVNELQLEWFRLIQVAYKVCNALNKHDIQDIVAEASYQALRLGYDELYGDAFEFRRTPVEDLLIATKVNFWDGEREFGACQNILLPGFNQEIILMTGGEIF